VPWLRNSHSRSRSWRTARQTGIEVSLLWSPADDSLTVVCADARTEEQFAVAAEPSTALGVFHHPYAYAARQRIGYHVSVDADPLAAA
jgi:hypothetical protein